jgi:2-C-methyl-D-erythritol 4-phosphate cytidylyltransferase
MSESWSGTSSPDASPRAAAIVVAGGSGRRMGEAAAGVRKQYLELVGEPILLWALRPFLRHPRVVATVVVLPAEDVDDPPEWLRGLPVSLVAGGAERSDSVWNGLRAVPERVELVLIHDGARPLVGAEVIDRVLARAAEGGAVPALPATDTLKEADEEGRVRATLDRSRLWHVQTPQGFPLPMIRDAHRRAREEGWIGTDDASLCERYGFPVRLVQGDAENLKVTRPLDLAVAEALARRLRAL